MNRRSFIAALPLLAGSIVRASDGLLMEYLCKQTGGESSGESTNCTITPIPVEYRDDGYYYWQNPYLGERRYREVRDGWTFPLRRRGDHGLTYRDGFMWPSEAGLIEDVRVSNRALTPAEVKEINDADYPVEKQDWHFEGVWSPSKSRMVSHLAGPNHRFPRDWLQRLEVNELWSLHDAHHEGRVQWQYVPQCAVQDCPT